MNLKRTATETAPATDTGYIFATKRVRIPRAAVKSIVPAADGSGEGVFITDRGATRVCEPYEECLAQFLGSIPADNADGRRVR